MTDNTLPSSDAALLQAYYGAWSQQWIDTRVLKNVLARASNVLWVGSYFSLAEPWANASWTLADVDRDMLDIGRRVLPDAHTVQADIRQLPFCGTFDTIVVLGAVTAYLLDDDSVERAAASLARCLARTDRARVLIDAYDAESIHSTSYFEGETTWSSDDAIWTRQARVQPLQTPLDVFAASLSVTRETPARRHSAHFHFAQRAFFGERLANLMGKHGLRLVAAESNAKHGRLYQIYSLEK